MLYGVVLVIHILVCVVLIGVVLLQGGRGGLSEALGGAAAQSLFGSSAVTVLTRMTTFCAGLFVVTCLSLAYLSTAQGRSVIEQVPMTLPDAIPASGLAFPAPSEQPATEPVTTAPSASTSEPSSTEPVTSP